MTLVWPYLVLPPSDINVDLIPRPISGGPALNGNSQWMQSDAGCWEITYTNVPVGNVQRIKCFRGLSGLLGGPVTPILVSTFDALRAPLPLDVNGNQILPGARIPYGDGTLFSDGGAFSSTVVEAVLAADVEPGDTTIQIKIVAGTMIESGQLFSLDECLYQVTQFLSVRTSGGKKIYTVATLPEARVAASSGDVVNFDNPVCRVRLKDGNQMMLNLTSNLIAKQTIQFIEDLGSAT